MFRNLRLKLTLINILVLSLIFTLIFSLIYFMMVRRTVTQSSQIMQMIAAEAGSNPISQIARKENEYSTYFYAKTNSSGQITGTSSTLPVTNEQLKMLLTKTTGEKEQTGEINLNGSDTYRFYKSTLNNGHGSMVIFVSTVPEKKLFEALLIILLTAGFTGMILVFFGGLFLADRALKPIKQSWQKQKDFAADASHELRTPIAVIQTNLELVLRKPDETSLGSQKKWLENIYLENKQMKKLVDDLLFLARADAQQKLPERRQFSIYDAVMDAVTPLEPVAAEKSLRLEVFLEPVTDFYGDEMHIKQLVVILADNAIKYTPPGGSIVIKLESSDTYVYLSVADTGEGIDKLQLEKIFDRFYRIDKARSRQSGGTGLGLAIADWIVKEHKGTITVESEPGKGTVFKVGLPKLKPTY